LLIGLLVPLPALGQIPVQASPAAEPPTEVASPPPPAQDPQLAYISILVQGAASTEVAVTYDGQPLPSGSLGVPLACQPGEHELQAMDGSLASPRVALRLEPGAVEMVSLTLTPPGAEPVASSATPRVASPPSMPDANAKANSDAWGQRPYLLGAWASVGVAALSFGVGTFFWLSEPHSGKADAIFAACDPTCTASEQAAVMRLDEEANSRAKAYTIGGFAVGGVSLAAAGVFFWLDQHRRSQPREQAGVTPVWGPTYAGVRGRF